MALRTIYALALIDVATNTASSIRIFPSQPTITFPVAFTPAGKNVAYRVIDKGTDNIWIERVEVCLGNGVNLRHNRCQQFSVRRKICWP